VTTNRNGPFERHLTGQRHRYRHALYRHNHRGRRRRYRRA
jgi:hypothetical protein